MTQSSELSQGIEHRQPDLIGYFKTFISDLVGIQTHDLSIGILVPRQLS